jgi:hypothetical protein
MNQHEILTAKKPRQPGQLVHLNALRHDERETRRAEAWALRLEGNTVRQIAEAMDISVGAAGKYLQETLAELGTESRESAESWRQIQLDRLDAVVAAWLPISRDPTQPEAARGGALVIRAVEAQSRLLGLLVAVIDAPAPAEGPPESFEAQLAGSPAMREAITQILAKSEKASGSYSAG